MRRPKSIPRKNASRRGVHSRMTLRNSAPFVADITEAILGDFISDYRVEHMVFDLRKPSDVGSIKLLGVRIDGERSGIVFGVTPEKNVDKRTATAWRKRREKWAASKEWLVTPVGEAIELTKRLTPATYRALRKQYLPDDHTEVPRTFGAPIMPEAPITKEVASLITKRIAKRIAGSVPVQTVLALVEAMPGWTWHSAVLARPMKGNLLEWFERKALNKGKGMEGYSVEGGGPVEIHRHQGSIDRADVDEIRKHVEETGYAATDFEHTDLPDGVYFTERMVLVPSKRRKGWDDRLPIVLELPRLQRAEAAVIVTAPDGSNFPLFRSDAGNIGNPDALVIEAPAFWKWSYSKGIAETAEAMLEKRRRAYDARSEVEHENHGWDWALSVLREQAEARTRPRT